MNRNNSYHYNYYHYFSMDILATEQLRVGRQQRMHATTNYDNNGWL